MRTLAQASNERTSARLPTVVGVMSDDVFNHEKRFSVSLSLHLGLSLASGTPRILHCVDYSPGIGPLIRTPQTRNPPSTNSVRANPRTLPVKMTSDYVDAVLFRDAWEAVEVEVL